MDTIPVGNPGSDGASAIRRLTNEQIYQLVTDIKNSEQPFEVLRQFTSTHRASAEEIKQGIKRYILSIEDLDERYDMLKDALGQGDKKTAHVLYCILHADSQLRPSSPNTLLDELKQAFDHAKENSFLAKVERSIASDDDLTPYLFDAAQRTYDGAILALLAAGVEVNKMVTADGATMLLLASQKGCLKVVQALLAKGADVNQAATNNFTPLYITSQNGHLNIVQALIAKGANVNKARSDNNATPLFTASANGHFEIVQALLANGADVNQATTNNFTPLYIASQNGHFEIVQALLANDADVNQATTDDNATPLYIASQNGHLNIVQALIAKGANVNKAKTNDNATPLYIASQTGHLNIVQALIAKGADVKLATTCNGAPLFIASANGHFEIVQALLANGADVNQATTNYNATPLFVASQNGHFEIVQALLANDADVNQATTDDNATPLFVASQNGHFEVVQALIANGADVNQAKTNDNATPLFVASQNGHFEVVEALLAKGADANVAIKRTGVTPLIVASINGRLDIVKALLAKGANVNKSGRNYDVTPLFMASQLGHCHVVRELLSRADISKIPAKFSRSDLIEQAKECSPLIQTRMANFINLQVDSERIEIMPEEIASILGLDEIASLIRIKFSPTFENRLNKINYTGAIPNHFSCPISQDIMNDPITTSSGVTYDRQQLTQYFAAKDNPDSLQCPITKGLIRIEELTFKTNITIKNLIDEFVCSKEREKARENTVESSFAVLRTMHMTHFGDAGASSAQSAEIAHQDDLAPTSRM